MKLETMKSSNFLIILMALTLAMPTLSMENHRKRQVIESYLASRPTEPQLIRAAVAGDALQVVELLDAGAKVDERDTTEFTSLLLAATLGHEEICRILIARGAQINFLIKDSIYMGGLSPLMAAAELQENDICRLLLQSKADVFIQNKTGWNALNHAQNQNAHETCKLLIDAMLKPTKEETDKAYFLLAFLNKKYPSAKDTNKLVVKYLLYTCMQLKKPMVFKEIKKVNQPPELIDYVNRK